MAFTIVRKTADGVSSDHWQACTVVIVSPDDRSGASSQHVTLTRAAALPTMMINDDAQRDNATEARACSPIPAFSVCSPSLRARLHPLHMRRACRRSSGVSDGDHSVVGRMNPERAPGRGWSCPISVPPDIITGAGSAPAIAAREGTATSRLGQHTHARTRFLHAQHARREHRVRMLSASTVWRDRRHTT